MSALPPGKQRLRKAADTVNREGGGGLDIHVVRRDDARRLILRADAGDREANGILVALSKLQRAIDAAPAGRPMRCAGCRGTLRGHRHNFIVALPAAAIRSEAISVAVCVHCGTDKATIRRKGLLGLALIWPDLREVRVTHSGGGRA